MGENIKKEVIKVLILVCIVVVGSLLTFLGLKLKFNNGDMSSSNGISVFKELEEMKSISSGTKAAR